MTSNENPGAAGTRQPGQIDQSSDNDNSTPTETVEQESWPTDALGWALWNARHRGRVHPVKANEKKPPTITENLRRGTRAENQIREWFTDPISGRSNDLNIALVCDGGEDGFVVVDLDPGANPSVIETFELYLDLWNAKPTFVVETATRGRHYYFRTAEPIGSGANTNKFLLGLDTRGGGTGYVVAAGSKRTIQIGKNPEDVEVRSYTILHNNPIAPMPKQLATALRGAPSSLEPPAGKDPPLVELDQPHNVERAREYLEAVKPPEVGSRNEWTNRRAFRVGDFSISEQMCINLMAEICLPNYPGDWTMEDLIPPIQSAYKSRKTPRGSGVAEVQFPPLPEETSAVAVIEAKARLELPENLADGADVIIDWDDNEDWENEPEPLVDGLVNQGEVGFIYGSPGAGKSFLAMRLSHSIASGEPFGDRFTTRGGALYVMGEAHGGAKKRKAAARKLFGGEKLPVRFVLTNLNLLRKGATQVLRHCEGFKDTFGDLPKLIVLDTLAALAAGFSENDADHATLLLHRLRQIATATGATILVLAHQGKDATRGLRGSSALLGAADFVIHADKSKMALTAEKLREDEIPPPMGFELISVDVGRRRDGRVVRSAVANILTKPKKNMAAIEAELRPDQLQLLRLIRSLVAERTDPDASPTLKEIVQAALAHSLVDAASEKDATDSMRKRLKKLQGVGLLQEASGGWRPVEATGSATEVFS